MVGLMKFELFYANVTMNAMVYSDNGQLAFDKSFWSYPLADMGGLYGV